MHPRKIAGFRRTPRRSRRAATLSSASGGCVIAPSRTAWRKLATASSLSLACHRPSGAAQGPRTRSSVCTRSSSDGSKPKPCYRRPILLRCCSGRCSPQGRSTCGKSTVGRRSPQTPSTNRLISLPDSVLSKCRRSCHAEFQHIERRHPRARLADISDLETVDRSALPECWYNGAGGRALLLRQ